MIYKNGNFDKKIFFRFLKKYPNLDEYELTNKIFKEVQQLTGERFDPKELKRAEDYIVTLRERSFRFLP